jgi:hypothetical protein
MDRRGACSPTGLQVKEVIADHYCFGRIGSPSGQQVVNTGRVRFWWNLGASQNILACKIMTGPYRIKREQGNILFVSSQYNFESNSASDQ